MARLKAVPLTGDETPEEIERMDVARRGERLRYSAGLGRWTYTTERPETFWGATPIAAMRAADQKMAAVA